MIYVVLGMHKSGTTLIAHLLHSSGVNMVEDDRDMSYETGNKRERHLSKTINKEILGTTGRVRFTDELLHGPLVVSADLGARMTGLIEALNARYVDWGFKDPRTCLTYPAWYERLPSHRVVFVYRSYAELLQRYNGGIRQLQLGKMRRVLYAWTHYNRHCMTHLERTKMPVVVVSYEALMSGAEELARLSSFVGRELADVRSERQRHNAVADRYRLSSLAELVATTLPEHPATVLRTLDGLRREQCYNAA